MRVRSRRRSLRAGRDAQRTSLSSGPTRTHAESSALLRRMALPGCAYSCTEPAINAVLVLQTPSLAQATPDRRIGALGGHFND